MAVEIGSVKEKPLEEASVEIKMLSSDMLRDIESFMGFTPPDTPKEVSQRLDALTKITGNLASTHRHLLAIISRFGELKDRIRKG